MFRLAILASHVIQYQDPFFRLLAADPEIDLTVIYCSPQGAQPYRDEDMKTTLSWDLEMLQGYRWRALRNFGRGSGYWRLVNPGVMPAIWRGRYDAVLFMLGWGTITSLLAVAACRGRTHSDCDVRRQQLRAAGGHGDAQASRRLLPRTLPHDRRLHDLGHVQRRLLPPLRRGPATILRPAMGHRQ